MFHALDMMRNMDKNTIKEKCNEVGINPSTYYRWLKGKYEPRAETVRKIYNALHSQKKTRQVLE